MKKRMFPLTNLSLEYFCQCFRLMPILIVKMDTEIFTVMPILHWDAHIYCEKGHLKPIFTWQISNAYLYGKMGIWNVFLGMPIFTCSQVNRTSFSDLLVLPPFCTYDVAFHHPLRCSLHLQVNFWGFYSNMSCVHITLLLNLIGNAWSRCLKSTTFHANITRFSFLPSVFDGERLVTCEYILYL